jgi:hypothetical protein
MSEMSLGHRRGFHEGCSFVFLLFGCIFDCEMNNKKERATIGLLPTTIFAHLTNHEEVK